MQAQVMDEQGGKGGPRALCSNARRLAPSLGRCSLAVPVHTVWASLLQVLSGQALVWRQPLEYLSRDSHVSSLGAFPGPCSVCTLQLIVRQGGGGGRTSALVPGPCSSFSGLLWSSGRADSFLPSSHHLVLIWVCGVAVPGLTQWNFAHCLEDNEGGSEPAQPPSLPTLAPGWGGGWQGRTAGEDWAEALSWPSRQRGCLLGSCGLFWGHSLGPLPRFQGRMSVLGLMKLR